MRGNISLRTVLGFSVALAAMFALSAGTAQATDLTWDTAAGDGAITGGAGTWDTTTGNWTTDGGANNVAWDNTANAGDTAVFSGTAGVVDLDSDITLNGMRIDTAYKIGDSSNETNILNFGGTTPQITLTVTNTYIYAGITGSPNLNVGLPDKNHSYLAPNVENMTLGHVTYTRLGSRLHLGGTTSGNSIASFSYNSYATIIADGTGTWTLGNISGPGQVELYQKSGNLIANGTLDISSTYFKIQGGVFHYNNAAAVAASKRLTMEGGDLDNSSGEAIVSTNNHAMTWSGDFTFIGSNGTDSDLNIGTGEVAMSASRQVTVLDPDTTLTVGGVIGDGGKAYGLTKAGDGRLLLNGVNTYDGMTTVAAGTLGGTGTIAGAVTVQGSATLAPGAGAGTLTIGTDIAPQSLTMDASSIYEWEVDATTADTIIVNGDLNLTEGWSIKLIDAGVGTDSTPTGEYDLFTYTGGFSGSLDAIIDPTGDWASAQIALDTVGQRVYLSLAVSGDADGDGDVDAADYIMIKTHFGGAPGAEGPGGDLNGDEIVDWYDLQILQTAYNAGAGGAPIPEPATLLIMMATGLPALLKRRRSRS